ncbi:MAG: hypothetical protein A2161_13510 [Candidatus Schekmanbacteria bacterium RBG_13_48_7]|uniref:AdoMet activation domain-containing protein n=1 Tax=Candidatus Schekmanbacteria bacterium RBG_13_48_7 TaxID=1817878 RepID=A0A1F7RSI2_9BACT|nr:MAG: hypothetical protein A2161_13510 [Candidatus Schekmanbacteria bacterium RBG_13_48_7]
MQCYIDSLQVKIPVKKVMNKLGYRGKHSQPHQKILRLIETEFETVRDLIDVKVIYGVCALDLKSPQTIILENNFYIKSMKLFKFLNYSISAYLMAITIGPSLDNHIKKLLENGEFSKAVIADVIGSESVEHAANIFHKKIRHEESIKSFSVTGRYSPGYGDWKLEDQLSLHELLETKRIGISLTEGYMMIPQKSISAIIGVFKKEKYEIPKI